MHSSLINSGFVLLAQAVDAETVTTLQYDWPQTPLGWLGLLGGFGLMFVFVVWMYLRDTREHGLFWRFFLLGLRLAVIAGLLVIALNPQERTRRRSFRNSQVAIAIDTSLSMRHPLSYNMENQTDQSDGKLTRAEAVQRLLRNSPLIRNLQRDHEVQIFTFDSSLHEGPEKVYAPTTPPGGQAPPTEPTAEEIPETEFWEQATLPRGLETAMGQSLLDLVGQVAGDQFSGLIVVGDGGQNSGKHPEELRQAALEKNFRLVTVGVGSTQPPRSLQLASVQAPTDVRFGDPYKINAFLQGRGLEDRELTVELFAKAEADAGEPKLIDTKKAKLKETGDSDPIVFDVKPSLPGTYQYEVKARPSIEIPGLQAGTLTHQMAINVTERNTGVLVIASGPMRDYRFVISMLDRHPDYDVDIWLQSVDPDNKANISQDCDIQYYEFPKQFPIRDVENLLPNWQTLTPKDRNRKAKEYDVVLAFDVDWNSEGFGAAPLDRQRQAVKLGNWLGRDSGGMVIMAGDVYTPMLANEGVVKAEELAGFKALSNKEQQELKDFSILDIYPVTLGAYLLDVQLDREADQPWPIAWTPKGRAADFYQLADTPEQNEQGWKDFEGIYRTYPTSGAKAGATVYANFSDFRTNTEFGLPVLMASQFYGSGRVYYIGAPETWRFRAMSEIQFDRFWLKVMQDAGQGRRKRGSSLTVEMMEKKYVIGQNVKVHARLQSPDRQPIPQDEATLAVQLPNGDRMLDVPKLTRDKTAGGEISDEFSAQFRANVPGQYKLEIFNPAEKEPLVVRVQVDAPTLEDLKPEQDAQLLTQIARDTGGAYFSIADAARLEQKLHEQRQNQNAGDAPEEPRSETSRAQRNQEKAPSELLPNRSQEIWVEKQLQTLWDRSWVMYLLIALLSVEWLTRKLLKLA